ncbi:hypothetical protein [Streptomyces parvus]|uniref:hypothetical protein n=1 Tax=Streptomyces parvus TaxID=66428 RepID=UPI003D752D8F
MLTPLSADDRATAPTGRLRTARRAAHAPAPGVSRRLRLIAYAVPLAVLPSSPWRIPSAFDDGIRSAERLYAPSLSIASELLALIAIGLIARWGEVFPRRVPYLGGRQVPRWAAVVPAAVGATVLTLVLTVLFIATEIRGTTIRGAELPADFPGGAGAGNPPGSPSATPHWCSGGRSWSS